LRRLPKDDPGQRSRLPFIVTVRAAVCPKPCGHGAAGAADRTSGRRERRRHM